jgi:hypothetical protein
MHVEFPYHHDLPEAIKAKARRALRNWAADDDFKKSNLSADAVVEQIWNALVGHS